MVIKNRKTIGFFSILIGISILLFWGNNLLKICTLSFTGVLSTAKVVGFKANNDTYGSRMVQKPSSFKSYVSGRSPFFKFISPIGDTVTTYSKVPQIFVLFNYAIGDEITVAFPSNEPRNAVIINWRELPGLLLMFGFGLLLLLMGKDLFFKKS